MLTFACIVKAMVFPVVTYGCESWTIKKAEHWRIDAFEPWCWRRLLRPLKDQTFYSPWNSPGQNTGVGRLSLLQGIFPTQGSNPDLPHCRHILYQLSYQESPKRSNQSVLKEINPEYSSEGLMLKLKLQYFGHLMWRADSLEKTLMLGKIEGRRRRGRQRMRWLHGITDWIDMSLSNLRQIVKDKEPWRAAVHGVSKSQTWRSDWTTKILSFLANLKGVLSSMISSKQLLLKYMGPSVSIY